MRETIKVGAVQAEPTWLNLQESIRKVVSLVEKLEKTESMSIWTEPYLTTAGLLHEYMANSLVKDSPEMAQIRAAAKKAGVFIVLGYPERAGDSLYISQSFIDPPGTIVLHRRKIKPTGADSLVNLVDSPFGKIGGLNCWEHFQPLLRYHEYGWGPDNRPALYTTTSEGDRLACQFMAMEGACFVVVSTQVLTDKGREKLKFMGSPFVRTPAAGFAMIFGPDGTPLVEPMEPDEEGILTAERKCLAD
ncbi:nitrilase [Trichoderma barbatum]